MLVHTIVSGGVEAAKTVGMGARAGAGATASGAGAGSGGAVHGATRCLERAEWLPA